MTRTEARQMSGPVPSPSMNGMIGWSGTASLPLAIVIFCPCAGTLSLRAVDIGKGSVSREAGNFGVRDPSRDGGSCLAGDGRSHGTLRLLRKSHAGGHSARAVFQPDVPAV